MALDISLLCCLCLFIAIAPPPSYAWQTNISIDKAKLHLGRRRFFALSLLKSSDTNHEDTNHEDARQKLPTLAAPVPPMTMAISSPTMAASTTTSTLLPEFDQALSSLKLSQSMQSLISQQMHNVGFTSCEELRIFVNDFIFSNTKNRPDLLSSILITDFSFLPLHAHFARIALLRMMAQENETKLLEVGDDDANGVQGLSIRSISAVIENATSSGYLMAKISSGGVPTLKDDSGATKDTNGGSVIKIFTNSTNHKNKYSHQPLPMKSKKKSPLYKQVIVNEKAKRRKQMSVLAKNPIKRYDSNGPDNNNAKEGISSPEYGLSQSYQFMYPTLAQELDLFYNFMIDPAGVLMQDPPIRPATADVYMRHAKLFLGWYFKQPQQQQQPVNHVNGDNGRISLTNKNDAMSLTSIIPTKERESASTLLKFILWLRSERHISVSYEANMVRGLIKLVKFPFKDESKSDPSYGEKSFGDIPLVREMRKLHRDASKRQIISPKSSSEEGKKWMTWDDYLNVVDRVKSNVEDLITKYCVTTTRVQQVDDEGAYRNSTAAQRKIATVMQSYLILAILASVPDRQRTIRELELGRTFIKNDVDETWVIHHSPEDYKTGGTYGDRPPLALPCHLTITIDDFLQEWRSCLSPRHDTLVFVQPRSGNPLTQDSVYQIVSRSCYKYAGKRTNPHLLRDMIVTHVRSTSNASERELESLALLMGHSITMQRTSYDKRTLTQKVAPAVQLLSSVNQISSLGVNSS